MSLDYRVHVGPFVACKVSRVASVEYMQTCTNPACVVHGHYPVSSGPFCTLCGFPIRDLSVPRGRDAVDAWDVNSAIIDRFDSDNLTLVHQELADCPPTGLHLWVANVDRGNLGISFDPVHDGTRFFDRTELDTAMERERFAEAFAGEIAVLGEKYGVGNVEVRWGVMNLIS